MTKAQDKPEFSKSMTQRLEAFSDGVFAIVITLLVLELRIPEVHGPYASEALKQGLIELLPKFISFIVSFLYISIYWFNHHQLFHLIDRFDRKLFWMNSVFLLCLTFVPFPTALIGSYPNDRVAATCYGLAMAVSAVTFVLMKIYIKFSGRLRKKVPLTGHDVFFLSTGPLLYLAAVGVGFVNVPAAVAIYILVPVIYFFAGASERSEVE